MVSPGSFAHARNFAGGGQFPEANAAQAEGAQIGPLAAAAKTAPHQTGGVLGCFFTAGDDGGLGHSFIISNFQFPISKQFSIG